MWNSVKTVRLMSHEEVEAVKREIRLKNLMAALVRPKGKGGQVAPKPGVK